MFDVFVNQLNVMHFGVVFFIVGMAFNPTRKLILLMLFVLLLVFARGLPKTLK